MYMGIYGIKLTAALPGAGPYGVTKQNYYGTTLHYILPSSEVRGTEAGTF
jgi:hypothetical protein